MKTKLLLILLFTGLQISLNAQAKHDYKQGCCKLAGKIFSTESCYCAGCAETDEKNRQAKEAEDKRVKAVIAKKEEEKRKAEQAELKRKEEERKEKERIASENKKREDERLKTEREIKNRIIEQIRKGNDAKLTDKKGTAEIDLKNIIVKNKEAEYILEYEGIPIKTFSKQSYKYVNRIGDNTNFFYGLNKNKEVVFNKPRNLKPGKKALVEIYDSLGKDVTNISGIYDFEVRDDEKIVVFYKYLSNPEFIRESSKQREKNTDYTKVLGFYVSDAQARNAIQNYQPQFEQWLDLHFYIVRVKAIITDFNLKVIKEEDGFLITEYGYL